MNQPPGGFDPPDDGYGGSGRRGGTIPGGPPIAVDGAGLPIAPPMAGPAGPSATVVDHAVSPAAFGPPQGAMPAAPAYPSPNAAPAYPVPNAGPIGYAPAAPPRRRNGGGGSGLGIIFGLGFVVLLIGGGAAGAVVYARGASNGTEEGETPPILTFAPPSTIEAEGVQPSVTDDPTTDPGEIPPEGTDVPGEVTPPPATTTAKPPPATTTARPPSTSTATATSTSTAKPPGTTTGTSTVRPPGPTPTATSTTTATSTATGTSTRWRTPWIIKPPATSTGTGTTTSTATGTSTSKPPRIPPGGFRIPRPK